MVSNRTIDEGRVRGASIWLRALEESDLEGYRAAANSTETGGPAGYGAPMGASQARAWFERVSQRHGAGEYFFAISPLGSDEFLGTVWLWGPDSRLGGLELSIFVTPEAGLGRGIGTDAVAAALDFAFGTLDVERVWLTTAANNARSRRAFAKAGFREDGVIRHMFRAGGEWRDSVLMSILRHEWESLDRRRGVEA